MGVNDALEQLEVAKAECVRLEAEVDRLKAAVPPCDGGCSVNTGPEETCSAHGRPVAEVWEMFNTVQAELAEWRAGRGTRPFHRTSVVHVAVAIETHELNTAQAREGNPYRTEGRA